MLTNVVNITYKRGKGGGKGVRGRKAT